MWRRIKHASCGARRGAPLGNAARAFYTASPAHATPHHGAVIACLLRNAYRQRSTQRHVFPCEWRHERWYPNCHQPYTSSSRNHHTNGPSLQVESLRSEYDMDVRVLGISTGKKMLLSEHGMPLGTWKEEFDAAGQEANLEAFAEHLSSHYVPNTVIFDCTASEVPPQHYLDWMRRGIHIITPNKKLNSGPLDQYLSLREFQRDAYIHYFYEVRCRA